MTMLIRLGVPLFCALAACMPSQTACGGPVTKDDAAPVDGGIADAAVPDAAVLDAAISDAAMSDGTMPDAAMPDAAMPDAAMPDAAMPDAAMPDATMPDATMPDATIPDATIPDASTGDAATRWVEWTRQPTPAYVGQYAFDSDSSIIRDGDLYRMTYTCFDPDKTPTRPGMVLCQATSTDGVNWTRLATGLDAQVEGKILDPVPGSWADTLETSFLLKDGNRYLLYFVGYQDDPAGGGFFASWPAQVGLATSDDGVHFTARAQPILGNRPAHFDADAISTPSVIPYNGGFFMTYAAYCFSLCNQAPAMVVAGATSPDGETWTALEDAVLLPRADVPWMSKYVGEAEIIQAPDGWFYLFATGISTDDVQSIGVMRAPLPTGPWDIRPTPILTLMPGQFDADHVVAPSVLVEGDTVRLWYSALSLVTRQAVLGYAHAPWPLVQ
jgi:beta-xylosidase